MNKLYTVKRTNHGPIVADCRSREAFEQAQQDKEQDPSLPFTSVERYESHGVRLAAYGWSNELKRWF